MSYLIFRILQIARSISSIDSESMRSFSASFLYRSSRCGYRSRRCIGAFSKLSIPCLNNWSSLFSFSATFKYAKNRSFSSFYGWIFIDGKKWTDLLPIRNLQKRDWCRTRPSKILARFLSFDPLRTLTASWIECMMNMLFQMLQPRYISRNIFLNQIYIKPVVV